MKRQKKRLGSIKFLLGLFFLTPVAGFAHILGITATTPFPASMVGGSTFTATFVVTNNAARVIVQAVNKSNFSASNHLSVTSNTCGGPLAPAASCTIQVTLSAPTEQTSIASSLNMWAQPSADGTAYPINVSITAPLPDITLVAANNSSLPALRDPLVGESSGNWLILSGNTGNFHDFNNDFNTSIYVYNPATGQIWSESIASTNLTSAFKNQLASSDPVYYQDGNTMYIIGGFWTNDNTNWITLQTISAVNVSGMMSAIINGDTNLNAYVSSNSSISQFKVTGGQLGKIGNYFYLVFGQECVGNYCATSQTYTNSIYQFTADATLSSLAITNTATHADGDGSGWRRRDYTLTPIMTGSTQTLFAMGGPFTPGSDADVWTNGINIFGNLSTNDNLINQQGNQYLAPVLPMYSSSRNLSYVATFGGLSNLYWNSMNTLVYDNTTPYGNILDLITINSASSTQEYVNTTPLCSGMPLSSCLYMGLTAHFIPASSYYDSRGILQLDQLPQNQSTLVGYIYAGLLSPVQDVFGSNADYPTNTVYAVYVKPAGSGSAKWKNVTNLNGGIG